MHEDKPLLVSSVHQEDEERPTNSNTCIMLPTLTSPISGQGPLRIIFWHTFLTIFVSHNQKTWVPRTLFTFHILVLYNQLSVAIFNMPDSWDWLSIILKVTFVLHNFSESPIILCLLKCGSFRRIAWPVVLLKWQCEKFILVLHHLFYSIPQSPNLPPLSLMLMLSDYTATSETGLNLLKNCGLLKLWKIYP